MTTVWPVTNGCQLIGLKIVPAASARLSCAASDSAPYRAERPTALRPIAPDLPGKACIG